MFTYKPGTPEARLADLFNLAERCGQAQSFVAGTTELDGAFEEARKAIGEQIRAVSAELGATSSPAAKSSTFKVGDEVWVRAKVTEVDRADSSRPVFVAFEDGRDFWPPLEDMRRT